MAKYQNGVKLYHYAFGPMTVVGCDDKYVEVAIDYPDKVVVATNVHERKVFNLLCVGHWIFENEADVLKIDEDFVHASTKMKFDANIVHGKYSSKSTSDKSVKAVKVVDENGKEVRAVKVMNDNDNAGAEVRAVKVVTNTGDIDTKK